MRKSTVFLIWQLFQVVNFKWRGLNLEKKEREKISPQTKVGIEMINVIHSRVKKLRKVVIIQ